MMKRTILILALATLAAPAVPARPVPAQTRPRTAEVPFRPGERLRYSVSYGLLPAGTMEIQVDDLVTYQGRPAYHLVSTAETNRAVSLLYELDSREESWFDAERFRSLRYRKNSVENDKERVRDYRFDQQRQVRIERDGDEVPTSPHAVDELAMIYYIRLLPLKPGATFELHNAADPKNNPLRVEVLKKERVKVPAGAFDAYVLDLDFKTNSGVFKKGGENRIWVTADSRHVPVRISSKVGVGSFQAELVDYEKGRPIDSAH